MAITRELSVVYGSLTVGAGTNFLIDGKVEVQKSYEEGRVAFFLVVTGSSEASFQTNCLAVENAYRTPRQHVQVFYGSHSHVDWDHNANTGFNQTANCVKSGSPHDTGRSRRYRVTLTAQLPSDLTGQNGRYVVSTTNLYRTDSGRMRLFLQGRYTALSSNGAREQYLASYNSWASGILAGLGGTWEGPFDTQEASDDADKNLSFSQTWEELIFDQSSGVLDDAQLRRQKLVVIRGVEAPGDSLDHGNVVRLESVSVDYEVSVDKAQTQDLATVYKTKVLPFLVATALSVTGSSIAALTQQVPRYDFVENRLSVQLTLLVAGSSQIISSIFRTDDTIDYGLDIVPVWTGDRMSKLVFNGPGRILRTITQVYRVIGGNASGLLNGTAGGAAPGVAAAGSGGGGRGIITVNQGPLFSFPDFGSGSAFSIGGSLSANIPGGSGGGGGVTANAASPGAGSLGDADKNASGAAGKPFFQDPDGDTLIGLVIGETMMAIPTTLGRPGDQQFSVTDYVHVVRVEFVSPVTVQGPSVNRQSTGGGNPP